MAFAAGVAYTFKQELMKGTHDFTMKFEILDKWFSAMKDWHVGAILGVFSGGCVMQWFGHLDANFVAFAAVVCGAITGHSFSPAGKPDDEPKG